MKGSLSYEMLAAVDTNSLCSLSLLIRIMSTSGEALHTCSKVDGEPWNQPAAVLDVGFRGTALMLRRLDSAPLARMAGSVSEALDACQVQLGPHILHHLHHISPSGFR